MRPRAPGFCRVRATAGRRTAGILKEANRQVALTMLAERRRVVLQPEPERWIRATFERLPFREAPLNVEVALASRALRIPSDDPADRFLAATARVFELTLVTADLRLRQIPHVTVLANT